ncbi:hypothetical protein B4923_17995 [Brenneria roseae subsp. americana]|uniref:Uncharacterized protein n=1 Tax=Brenneria roseae subsp. americana TaxID=1508507 RepID=A0A2U1TKW4_9GAMM|nr:hypothetical protein B4923_17995 [Brenneria roseae subsp. americana]
MEKVEKMNRKIFRKLRTQAKNHLIIDGRSHNNREKITTDLLLRNFSTFDELEVRKAELAPDAKTRINLYPLTLWVNYRQISTHRLVLKNQIIWLA